MTYRSRNSKLTKDGQSEIIMESIKFRLHYDKSFIINERYLPRKLKLSHNPLNTIAHLHNYTNTSGRYLPQREDSLYNSNNNNSNNNCGNLKNGASDSNSNFTFFKQPLNRQSPRKSNHTLQVNEEYYVPSHKGNKDKLKSTDFLKDVNAPIELPLINEPPKNYYQSIKKKATKMRLRNLLDDGSELNFKTSNEKLNAYVISENLSDTIYMDDRNYEKQMRQIDLYKDFKSKLAHKASIITQATSRRLPLEIKRTKNTSPNFMVLPISRYNPIEPETDPEHGREHNFDHLTLSEGEFVKSKSGFENANLHESLPDIAFQNVRHSPHPVGGNTSLIRTSRFGSTPGSKKGMRFEVSKRIEAEINNYAMVEYSNAYKGSLKSHVNNREQDTEESVANQHEESQAEPCNLDPSGNDIINGEEVKSDGLEGNVEEKVSGDDTKQEVEEEYTSKDPNYLDVKYEESIEVKSEIGEHGETVESLEITLDDLDYQSREKEQRIKTAKSGRESQGVCLPKIASRATTEYRSAAAIEKEDQESKPENRTY